MATRTRSAALAARKQPKQARSKELVAAVLTAAARVFDREGLSATTNRVAEEAGVSVGSLYQYFPNKESLLAALAERHVLTATALVRTAIERHAQATSLRDFMGAVVAAVLKEHRAHPHLRALLRVAGPQDAELAARFDGCIADAQRAIADQISRLSPDVPNPKLRAQLVTAAVDGVIHSTEALNIDEHFEQEVVALCVGYLEH